MHQRGNLVPRSWYSLKETRRSASASRCRRDLRAFVPSTGSCIWRRTGADLTLQCPYCEITQLLCDAGKVLRLVGAVQTAVLAPEAASAVNGYPVRIHQKGTSTYLTSCRCVYQCVHLKGKALIHRSGLVNRD